MSKKAFLLILDGWGIGPKHESDAIYQANTPYFDQLWATRPHSTLITHGEDVGLPDGQMGNSEVGHLNIGAGRIVWQELARINKAVREGEIHKNKVLLEALDHAKATGVAVHFMGLVSDGGVHSHISHLMALGDIALERGCQETYIHAFTDGRDCDPKSGAGFITELTNHFKGSRVTLATVIGRYYAMDRDKRWERVKLAFDLLVNGVGEAVNNFQEAIQASYSDGVTDEFLKPMRNAALNSDQGKIKDGDVVICFNFRTDRCREITQVLTQQEMHEFNMHTLNLHYVTMTRYDETFRNVEVMFEKDDVKMTMGEVLEKAGKTQVRIAETEKYPHVTFFFSGGREAPFEGERRIMLASPKVATYDLQPEMSAIGIKDAIMADIRENEPDFICLNFANTDMVGHTGIFSAAMKAAETVDSCLSQIIPLALEKNYSCIIIADHGNSDYMINEDGTPNTAHTKNPVPCILVSNEFKQVETLKDGRLADVAPTILNLMGIEKGEEMTGVNLID
ncbi:MAG: 2,3-bisphosphoglycerate-independent phosphoglycerate mutase [Lewinellaceae bacterium]|nr:2,3-bisphosphoglycerate-independent phosphoglycerate mutase [Saprospiraceae bacterium]MCB9345692.1 2,3-bisphosphoglycerate-independent phosphoglycerate mutase [Lewinellaceae bacterium]